MLKIERKAGSAQAKAPVGKQGRDRLTKGDPNRLRIHGAIGAVIPHAAPHPLYIAYTLQQDTPGTICRVDHNGAVPSLIQFIYGAVQHLEKLLFIYGLEQIEKSTDVVAVGGEVVGTGEINDLTALPQSP